MFGWAHHTYLVPSETWIRTFAYFVSMTELYIFGKIIWDYCGMDRSEAGLDKALSEIPALHEEFKKDLKEKVDLPDLKEQPVHKAHRVIRVLKARKVLPATSGSAS